MARSRHTPAANGGKWLHPSTRWAIYHRDSFKCLHVGTLTIDHLRSVRDSGRNNDSRNLVTCCRACNSEKQDLSMRAWFSLLRQQGYDVGAIRTRIARLVRRRLDREVGRFLSTA